MSDFLIQPGTFANVEQRPKRRLIDPENVRRLAARGLLAYQIAQQLGCSDKGISRLAYKYGILIRRSFRIINGATEFWQERTPTLIEKFNSGMTIGAISREMGLTKNQVVGRLNTLGRIGERRPKKPKHLAQPHVEFPAPGGCVYPLGPLHEPPTEWCGSPVREIGKPYCDECHRKAYKPMKLAEYSEAAE